MNVAEKKKEHKRVKGIRISEEERVDVRTSRKKPLIEKLEERLSE